jgi:hypothetical protein
VIGVRECSQQRCNFNGDGYNTPRLIYLELKDYIQTEIPFDKLFDNLIQKIRDTLSLFTAAWLQQGLGAELQQELPHSYRQFSPDYKLIFVLLVNIDDNQSATIRALREKSMQKYKVLQSYTISE